MLISTFYIRFLNLLTSPTYYGIARGIRTLTYFRTLDSKSRLSTNSSIATYYGLDGGTRTPILYAPNIADSHYHTSRYYFKMVLVGGLEPPRSY